MTIASVLNAKTITIPGIWRALMNIINCMEKYWTFITLKHINLYNSTELFNPA